MTLRRHEQVFSGKGVSDLKRGTETQRSLPRKSWERQKVGEADTREEEEEEEGQATGYSGVPPHRVSRLPSEVWFLLGDVEPTDGRMIILVRVQKRPLLGSDGNQEVAARCSDRKVTRDMGKMEEIQIYLRKEQIGKGWLG